MKIYYKNGKTIRITKENAQQIRSHIEKIQERADIKDPLYIGFLTFGVKGDNSLDFIVNADEIIHIG